MTRISQRLCCLEVATGFGLMADVFFFWFNFRNRENYTVTLLVLSCLVTLILFFFLIREEKNFKTAWLIFENRILHIQPAKISYNPCSDFNDAFPVGIEVFISCFGILLGSKIIEFNLKGISLKTVEIEGQFICLRYGTETQSKSIRILHEGISSHEIQCIVEKFRYETGVVPIVTERFP